MRKLEKIYSLLLLLVALIWGTGFIATQIAIDAMFSSGFIMLVRFALAAVVFGLLFHKDVGLLRRKDLFGGVCCGILLFASFFLQTVGLRYTTPASNAFITAANIVLVPFLTWILFRKQPPVKAFVGALLCFLGVWALSWQPGSGGFAFGKGELLTLTGALCFAMHTTCLGYFAGRIRPRGLNFLQLATAALLSVLYFLVADRDFRQFIPQTRHMAVIYLAIFSTCIAYFIQTTAQKHVAPSKVAVIIATESLFASLLSVLLGYETPGANLVVGGAMVLLSVCVVEVEWNHTRRKKTDENDS